MEAMKQLEKDGMELVPKKKAKEQSRFVNLLNQKHLLSLHLRLFSTLDISLVLYQSVGMDGSQTRT